MKEILSLPLRALDRPLKIRSRTLNAEFWLVPPDAADCSFDAPVYTTTECLMLLLMDLTPAELKAVHLVKQILEGELSSPSGSRGLREIYEELMAEYRDLESRIGERPDEEEESRLLSIAGRISRLLGCAPELENEPRLS